MAALTITTQNVQVNQDRTSPVNFLTGEAISEGEPVYLDTSADPAVVRKAECGDTIEKATVIGIAVTPCTGSGQYVSVAQVGSYNVGATVAVGQEYYLGATAGKIVPFADLVTDDYVVPLFRAETTTQGVINLGGTPTIQIP